MGWHHLLKRAMTIFCSVIAAALLSDSHAFAREGAFGGADTRTSVTSSPGTADQTVRQRSSVVIGDTYTTTTESQQERRRERPRDVRRDDKGSGKQENTPRQPSVSDSSQFKTRLDQSATSVVGTGNKSSLKLKLQQPKPRTGPGPR